MRALRRRYPQIYRSNDRLLIDPASIVVGRPDFLDAVKGTSFLYCLLMCITVLCMYAVCFH